MQSKSPINETVIANALVAIFERLGDIEKSLVSLAQGQERGSAPGALLKAKLDRLTIKRHAVLTATLGGVSYQEIAKYMACDVSTVKLHLRAALNILGIRDRAFLLAACGDLLDFMSDEDYERCFGLTKRWWLACPPSLAAVLQTTKPAKNQYTRGTQRRKGK